jgi:hypothetical protein
MKNWSIAFLFTAVFFTMSVPQGVVADGMPDEARPARRARHQAVQEKEEVPPPPAPPACVSRSEQPKVRIVSWNPRQKVSKFLGEITECVTTQWDIIKMLPGPNVINVEYPSEQEQWGYLWMWDYKLKNPIEDTVILMDNPGKRVQRYQKPVELYIVFNENDVVEKVSMNLVRK